MLPVYSGKIQDYERLNNPPEDTEVIYFSNDSYYYLYGWKPKFIESKIYVSGGTFASTLGTKILLPFGEGFYSAMPDFSTQEVDGM
jgi:hypothetical protein